MNFNVNFGQPQAGFNQNVQPGFGAQQGNPSMGQPQAFTNFNIPQPAANANIEWKGWYEQNGQQHEMIFFNLYFNNNGQIIGNGTDTIGTFTIQGNVAHNGETVFTKQYTGAHAVQYHGAHNGSQIKGKWTIPGNCEGNFQLDLKSKVWNGSYTQNGNKTAMSININETGSTLFGTGCDTHGNFII